MRQLTIENLKSWQAENVSLANGELIALIGECFRNIAASKLKQLMKKRKSKEKRKNDKFNKLIREIFLKTQ